jgi:uncharacterized protein (DUF433 family)/DNA-binding transcriptional MerR regulator
MITVREHRGSKNMGEPRWDRATYPAAEVGRLVGLHPSRVRRWLRGYKYHYDSEVHHQDPVVSRTHDGPRTYASFLDLVDLLFVKGFLDHGLSLQRVRKALEEATRILGTAHFARKSFFTDGRDIYLQVKEAGDDILELLSGGQWVIAPVIMELAEQIDFEAPSGLARRWYPLGPKEPVVLDPSVSFGRPSVEGTGIATANVFDFFRAEGEDLGATMKWLELEAHQVEAAVQFERKLN